MNTATAAALGVLFILIILAFRWKWRANKITCQNSQFEPFQESSHHNASCHSVQLVHRLCPHNNVVQRFRVEEKDSLDEHLDVLTRKLAEKEGRLRLSKSKIRQTQNEIENLHAIDHEVRSKYRDMMESLRKDLLSNEQECKKLQQQIEWVSHRRAELKDEISRGQQLYGKAAAELASNLAELQRGRATDTSKVESCQGSEVYRVIDKPNLQTVNSLRARKEPQLPHAMSVTSNSKAKNVASREIY